MGNGRTLKVAVLECERLQEHLAPAVYARTGGYLQLLQQAFTHVYAHASSILHPQINVPPELSFTETDTMRKNVALGYGGFLDVAPFTESCMDRGGSFEFDSGFDVKAEEYPTNIGDFDGVLITGSLSGVYDEEPWIQRLLHEIEQLDKKKVKTVGISFGHQAIAQALGGHVTHNPKGSEVSVRKAWLTKAGEQVFLPRLKEFRLHYHHNDAILKLPPGFLNLASNNVTEFQSIYKRQQFLTFCGHPDYSNNIEVLEKLLQYDREKLWVPEQLIEHGLATLAQPTDYEWVIKQILLFYMGHFDKSP